MAMLLIYLETLSVADIIKKLRELSEYVNTRGKELGVPKFILGPVLYAIKFIRIMITLFSSALTSLVNTGAPGV